MRRTQAILLPDAEEQYLVWLERTFRHPGGKTERRQLAAAFLASLLDVLVSMEWVEGSRPLPAERGRRFAVPIYKNIRLIVEVVEPAWWQFWKPRRIIGQRFQEVRFEAQQ